MTSAPLLEKHIEPGDLDFAEEKAVADVAMVLGNALEATNVSQKELAARLCVSDSRVSQLLSGDSNPTVRTLARALGALGLELRVTAVPKDQR